MAETLTDCHWPHLSVFMKLGDVYKTTHPLPVDADVLFERYRVEPRGNDPHQHLASALRERGLATFGEIHDRPAFARMARALAALYTHPDSEPDGLTLLHARDGSPGSGQRGFTDSELFPHTERSCLPKPPQLLMLMYLTPANHGGESVLIDGRAVAKELSLTTPETWSALSTPRSAYFGGSSGYVGAVFEPAAPERWSIRLRLDQLIRFAHRSAHHVEVFREVMDRHTMVLRLGQGQGFILDNTRWLHGRHAFTGPRVMLRALGEPHTHIPLERGFRLP
ncbi:TauD/TfdA family dioxygenase [Nocardiopsis alba]|uniref:TauD/TfdA family dioxygenase n=1 Tax=Nocardiopsis alba TaxID=53437 RepID=UPI0033D70D51